MKHISTLITHKGGHIAVPRLNLYSFLKIPHTLPLKFDLFYLPLSENINTVCILTFLMFINIT